jgi:hypothetical protein
VGELIMSGLQVCMGASLACSFGAAPSTLAVLPVNQVFAGTPAANVLDHLPLVNVLPFGVCSSPANPVVAAATAAAFGVLTPMPCVPATAAPWLPGNLKVLLRGAPALDASSRLLCLWGGSIQVSAPGQTVVTDG